MQLVARLTALSLLSLFLGSCATMTAYEAERQAKRAKTAAVPAGATAQPATILQPNLPPPKIDTVAIAADKAVASAEKQLSDTDPNKTNLVAPGPNIPILKTLLTSRQDLDALTKSYAAYAQAVSNVRTSLEAFGLKANIDGLRKVREAGQYWALYLPRMRIRPSDQSIKAEDIQGFYSLVAERGKQVGGDISQINRYIDNQRTRAWSVSSPSK